MLIGHTTCSMDRLVRHPNVHWLGQKPHEEIPRYGSGFDVALMPWLDNEWIRSCNPIKMKEYLALGLPVVSTDFPEVRHYADVIRVAAGHATSSWRWFGRPSPTGAAPRPPRAARGSRTPRGTPRRAR